MNKRQFKSKATSTGIGRGYGAGSSELWLECARCGIAEQPDIRTALQQISINPQDVECIAHVKSRIRTVAIQEILNPEPFRRSNPTRSNKVSGPIFLGRVRHSGVLWGIHQDALTEHLICVGRTGGGKTTVIKKILSEILKRRKT